MSSQIDRDSILRGHLDDLGMPSLLRSECMMFSTYWIETMSFRAAAFMMDTQITQLLALLLPTVPGGTIRYWKGMEEDTRNRQIIQVMYQKEEGAHRWGSIEIERKNTALRVDVLRRLTGHFEMVYEGNNWFTSAEGVFEYLMQDDAFLESVHKAWVTGLGQE